MVTHRQRVAKGTVNSEHTVQLFDVPESLGESVAAFLHEGLLEGAPLLVVARPANLRSIGDALTQRGLSMPALIEDQSLVVLDAHTTLNSFMRNGAPHPPLFDASVASVVGRFARGTSARLRVYGEMVDILAEEGNYRGAEELEELWNALGTMYSFSLLCGYASAHFAAPDAGDSLQHICHRHTRVHQNHVDLLANWLLRDKALTPVA
jgi:hypothetical protein